jgi:hypothetical protein
LTLAADLTAPGNYAPLPPAQASRTASVDGYDVTLAGYLRASTSSKLTLNVSKGGVPVTDLQPYLAAYGHLVAIRDGDLATCTSTPTATSRTPRPSPVPTSRSTPTCRAPRRTSCSWTSSTPVSCGPPGSQRQRPRPARLRRRTPTGSGSSAPAVTPV